MLIRVVRGCKRYVSRILLRPTFGGMVEQHVVCASVCLLIHGYRQPKEASVA